MKSEIAMRFRKKSLILDENLVSGLNFLPGPSTGPNILIGKVGGYISRGLGWFDHQFIAYTTTGMKVNIPLQSIHKI